MGQCKSMGALVSAPVENDHAPATSSDDTTAGGVTKTDQLRLDALKSLWQGRSSLMDDVDMHSLDWLNDIVKSLFPHINKALADTLPGLLEDELRKNVPPPMKAIAVKSFDLGKEHPLLGPIKAYPKVMSGMEAMQLDMGLHWDCNCKMEMNVPLLPDIGVKKFKITGDISVVLCPIMDHLPVVGGVQVFMISPPQLDWGFTGAGSATDWPIFSSAFRNTVMNVLNNVVVLPNRIFIAPPKLEMLGGKIKTEEFAGDLGLLQFPIPEAILEVGIVAARNLEGKDWNLFGKATSDPYAVIRIGAHSHKTPAKKETLEPTWGNDGFGDFLLFNPKQCIQCEILDEDLCSADDFIGRLVNIDVSSLVNGASQWMPIYEVDVHAPEEEKTAENKKQTGEVKLDIRVFELMTDRHCLLNPPEKRAPGKAFIMIQARCLRGLSKEESKGARLKLSWEDTQVDSKRSKYLESHDARICDPASQRLVEFLVTDQKLDIDKVSEVSGLSPDVIAKVLKKRPSFTCRWNQGFSGVIKSPQEATFQVALEIPNESGLPAAKLKAPLNLSDFLAEEKELTWEGLLKLERESPLTEAQRSKSSEGPFDLDLRIQLFGLKPFEVPDE